MTHPDGVWQPRGGVAFFRCAETGETHYLGECGELKLEDEDGETHKFGSPVLRWRKRCVTVAPVKKVRPRRRIKRKPWSTTITMEGISRETASLFIGVPCPAELQEFDEFHIFTVESPGGEIDSTQELADKVLP